MFELIKSVSVRVAAESGLPFLINDVNSILKQETPYNQREIVEKLERAFVNANYAGYYKAGKLSFLFNDYLQGYDVFNQLNNFTK